MQVIRCQVYLEIEVSGAKLSGVDEALQAVDDIVGDDRWRKGPATIWYTEDGNGPEAELFINPRESRVEILGLDEK